MMFQTFQIVGGALAFGWGIYIYVWSECRDFEIRDPDDEIYMISGALGVGAGGLSLIAGIW